MVIRKYRTLYGTTESVLYKEELMSFKEAIIIMAIGCVIAVSFYYMGIIW